MAEKIVIRNEKDVTKADIIAEADSIWQNCQNIWNGIAPAKEGEKAIKISENNHKLLDELYMQVRDQHKDFNMAYPTVLRHMIQEKNYVPAAFAEYMDFVEKAPWNNDKERLDSYAEYAIILYRHRNAGRKVTATEIGIFRRKYREGLEKELNDFKENVEKHKEDAKKEQERREQARSRDLIKSFKRAAAGKLSEDQIAAIVEQKKGGQLPDEKIERIIFALNNEKK